MSKNLIKQLHAQIKSHNQKLVTTIKSDINKEYEKKFMEMNSHFKNREAKIKKVYQTFLSKLDTFQEKQNRESEELKMLVAKINKCYENENSKRMKIVKKIDEMKQGLKAEMKRETDGNEKMKRKVECEVDEMRKKIDVRVEKMKKEAHEDDLKNLLSSIS